MANYTRKQLAELAIRLMGNIDQADQFDNAGWIEKLIQHADKACLIELIKDLKHSVECNINLDAYRFLFDSEEDLQNMLQEARKVLGEDGEL